jgi:hypothetical protein
MTATYATWNGYVGQDPLDFCQGVETIVLKHGRPLTIDLQEASRAFKPLKHVAADLGYDLVWRPGMGVESRSTLQMVAQEVDLLRSSGLMMETNWKGPKLGIMHPGRVFPTSVLGPVPITGFPRQRHTTIHMPPGVVVNRKAVNASIDLLVSKGGRWCHHAIWMGDWNFSWGSPQALRLARRLGAQIVKDAKEARIDWALVRGAKAAHYEAHAKLGSDTHKYGILKVEW